MSVDIPLILFAKAPVAGKVKTRLMPALTAQQAVEVAETLLDETLTLATVAWPGQVILAVHPDAKHPFIQRMIRKYNVECFPQADGDLGNKLFQAMESVGYPCAVMGCDVPHCSAQIMQQAYRSMQDSKSVIGPTEDGGYYLLGLQSSCSALFQSIVWGEDRVAKTTLATAEQQGVVLQPLAMLNDIDDYADLLVAASQLPVLARLLD